MGTGITKGNGIHECHYVNSTELALYDLTNTAIVDTGGYFNGQANAINSQSSAAWVSQLAAYTLGSSPLGYFDGPNGVLMRRLSLSPYNGMATSGGLVLTGCPSACVIAVTTTYNPITGQGNFPAAVGNRFSVTGTGTSLDTCGDGTESAGAQSPYTMASVSSSGWVSNSFACSGLSNGDYTTQKTSCGPDSPPDDGMGGRSQSCARVSQLAHTANPWWTGMETAQTNVNGVDLTQSTYKTYWDGGFSPPAANSLFNGYAMGAIRFAVDPTSTFYLGQTIYALNYAQRVGGVNFTWNETADTAEVNYWQSTYDFEGLALLYAIGSPYWAASEKTAFLNKIYNDLDDPTYTNYSGGSSQCTKSNAVSGGQGVDESTPANHNWGLASGNVASGTNNATHVTLASSAHCIVNSIVMLANGNGSYSNSYGLVTSCSGAVATVSGWVTGSGGTGTPAGLNNLLSITYQGGLTASGTAGQACWLAPPGGYFATWVALTGTNTLPSSGTALPIGGYASQTYSSAPTTMSPSGLTGFGQSPATCTGTANVATTLGTAYTVFDAFSLSGTSSGSVATATFTSSSLVSSIAVGDALIGHNGWMDGTGVTSIESYVCAVGPGSSSACGSANCGTLTAKQACVINGAQVYSSLSSTPAMAWRVPQWTTYDCGFIWSWKHYGMGSQGVTNSVYPLEGAGGNGGASGSNQIISEGGNLGAGDLMQIGIMDLAAANDDSRAVRDLARTQSWWFDYEARHYMDFSGGTDHSGSSYGNITKGGLTLDTWALTQSLANATPSYPSLDLTGPWMQGAATWRMFDVRPDQYGHTQLETLPYVGQEADYGLAPGETPLVGFPFDGSFLWAPSSNTAGYLRNFMEHRGSSVASPYSLWGGSGGTVGPTRSALAFLAHDPNVADIAYSNQPTQIVKNTSSSAACASLTGWPCYQFRGDMMISTGPWLSAGSPNLSASQLHADFHTYTSDYDIFAPGDIRFYKAAPLIGPDTQTPSANMGDDSIQGGAIQFGGPQSSYFNEFANGLANNENNVGKITISNWGGQANSGSFPTAYGDSQSRYAYVSGNVAPAYNVPYLSQSGGPCPNLTIPYANRSIFHSKPSGGDEFIFLLDDVSVGVSCPVAVHVQYPQTGQTLTVNATSMPTGKTICVNSSYAQVACSGLNTNRLVEELEDGGEYSNNPPARDYGLMSWFTSPGTITLNWDCPGSYTTGNQPQCSPSSPYTGGNGYTNRVTVAAGSSVGAPVSGEQTWLIVHKVMQSLTDATIQPTAFNPNSTWTGAQVCGASSCAVGMFAIGNATQSTIPVFTTTHAGTAQYLIAGLTPGTYSVKVGGTAVSGSPFTVPVNDTSLEFESVAGTVSITVSVGSSAATSSKVSGQAAVSGNVTIH